MPVVRSKICGITRVEDALVAAAAGADAIGLVFYARSPRAVSVQQARAIVAALPPFVTTVGLFVDAAPGEINEILDAVPLDLLQFHGDESAAECSGYHRPYIKALRVRRGEDIRARCADYPQAAGILLDTFVPGVPAVPARRSTGVWSRGSGLPDHPGRWPDPGQRRGGNPPGASVGGGCQWRGRGGQGHQGCGEGARLRRSGARLHVTVAVATPSIPDSAARLALPT